MTVKELIEKLQEFDENLQVCYDDESYGPQQIHEMEQLDYIFTDDEKREPYILLK
jgi:hypothetical protein